MSLESPPPAPPSGASLFPFFCAVLLALFVLLAQDDAERFIALVLCGIAALLMMLVLCLLAGWMLGVFKKKR